MLSKYKQIVSVAGRNMQRKSLEKIRTPGERMHLTGYDRVLNEKMRSLGINGRLALFFGATNVFFYLVSHFIEKRNYLSALGYDKDSHSFYKAIFSQFASTQPINVFFTSMALIFVGVLIEKRYSSLTLLKITLLGLYATWTTLSLTTHRGLAFTKSPIDSIEENGKYYMGAHGIASTYIYFALLKRGHITPALALFLIEVLFTGPGYTGGALAGYLAYLLF